MARDRTSAAALLARAEEAWAGGDGESAMTLFDRAAVVADDPAVRTAAVLGLARGQQYNQTPGLLPVRLHSTYEEVDDPRLRARLAAALARCWSYANEPRRARPFAIEALHLADQQDDPVLLADALDAALASHWGPDDLAVRRDWAVRLGDTAAHLADLDARLQAELWSLTVAWEALDLPRMHRSMRAIELLADESPKAEFFAASRRLPLELLRRNFAVAPGLVERARAAADAAVIPDVGGVLHCMVGYSAFFSDDVNVCAAEAGLFEAHAVDFGVIAVRAEAALMWLGAGRLDKVAEMVGAFTPDVLVGLPRDSDWLLTTQCVLEGALAVGDTEVTAAVLALLAPAARSSTPAPSCGTGSPMTRSRVRTRSSASRRSPPGTAPPRWRRTNGSAPAGGATACSPGCRRRPPTTSSRSTSTHRRAACGWSAGRARRSCCPGCADSCTCTRSSGCPTPTCPR